MTGTRGGTSWLWGACLGLPFFAWMYGAPVGFVVVLVYAGDPAAQWYALAWVSLTVAVPLVGAAVAYLFQVGQWWRRFAGAAVVGLVFAVAGSLTWHVVTPGPVGDAPSATYLQEDCVRPDGARHCPVG